MSPGLMLQLHQHIPGAKSGSALIVAEGEEVPVQYADRFQVYRPTTLSVAVGDQLRVTLGGKTKNGKRLENGDLIRVKGFNKQGDILDSKGRVIDKEFGHLEMGLTVTAFASQGRTVDKVLISQSAASGPGGIGRAILCVGKPRPREGYRLCGLETSGA